MIRKLLARAGLLAVPVVAAGCAATAPAGADQVAHLAGLPLPPMRSIDIDPATRREVDALLARPLDPDAAVAELGVPHGALVQAGLLPDPEIEVEVRRPEEERQLDLELRVELELGAFFLRPLRSRAARDELQAARLDAAAQVVALARDARVATVALQVAEERRRLAADVLEAQAAALDAARALVEAGNAPALELVTQEAAFESAQAAVVLLDLDAVAAREHLATLLGIPGDVRWSVRPGPPAVPATDDVPPEVEARAVTASLELAAAQRGLSGADRRIALARAEGALPHLSVALFGEREDRTWAVGAGLRLAVPVLDRGRGRLLSARAGRAAGAERLRGLELAIRSDARRAAARVRLEHRRAVQYASSILPARRRVLDEVLLHYNAMQLGVFQLLEARRLVSEAEQQAAEAIAEYWTARAELDALLAGVRPSSARSRASAPVATTSGAPSHEEDR